MIFLSLNGATSKICISEMNQYVPRMTEIKNLEEVKNEGF